MNSGYVGTGVRERDSLKGEHGRGLYVYIGGGEHTVRNAFTSPSASLPPSISSPASLSVHLSIPSGGCSVWAWPDCG